MAESALGNRVSISRAPSLLKQWSVDADSVEANKPEVRCFFVTNGALVKFTDDVFRSACVGCLRTCSGPPIVTGTCSLCSYKDCLLVD